MIIQFNLIKQFLLIDKLPEGEDKEAKKTGSFKCNTGKNLQ